MQGRLTFCLRASVLSLALFACSTGEPTAPGDPEDPETPPLPATVSWSDGAPWPDGFIDRDGDVTGAAGAYVVPNHPFLVTPSCTLRAEWNNSSNPLPPATDLAELEVSPGDGYWYDTGTGMLHLKLVTRSGRNWATIHVEPE